MREYMNILFVLFLSAFCVICVSGEAGLPEAPEAPTVSSVTQTTLVVSWLEPSNNGSNLDYYKLEMKEGNDANPWTVLVSSTATNETLEESVSALTPGQSYIFRVYSHNGIGMSLPSNASEWVTTIPPGVPFAPAKPVVTEIGDTSLVLEWTQPNDNYSTIDTYKIEYMKNGTVWELWDDDTGDVLLMTISVVNMSTPYQFRVYAHNAFGWSSPSPASDEVETTQNECSLGTHNCHATAAVCINTPIGFNCSCVAGWSGDGVSCGQFARIDSFVANFDIYMDESTSVVLMGENLTSSDELKVIIWGEDVDPDCDSTAVAMGTSSSVSGDGASHVFNVLFSEDGNFRFCYDFHGEGKYAVVSTGVREKTHEPRSVTVSESGMIIQEGN